MNPENLASQLLQEYLAETRSEPRSERKFVVPRTRRAEAERLIRFHPFRFAEEYTPRRINNIYLDTKGFKYYNDSIEGLSNRIKIRIRWYGDLINDAARPVLEIKLKYNAQGYKLAFPLASLEFTRRTNTAVISEWLGTQEIHHIAKELIADLQPVLVNTYIRSYWTSSDGKLRLTLDNDLEYYPFARYTDTLLTPACYDNHIILEIKNHPEDDISLSDFANSFLPRITRYSKYTNGVDLLFIEQSMAY